MRPTRAVSQAHPTLPTLPASDGLVLIPVHEDCHVLQALRCFNLPAVAVVLGASYFQRMLVRQKASLVIVDGFTLEKV